MKSILRFFIFIALLALNTKKSDAQCAVSNIVIQNVIAIGSTPTSCTIKFDETFNIASNNGNKFIFIHGWLQADYPDYFKCVNGQTTINGSIAAPTAADLGNTFFNIGLDNTGPVPIVLTSYPPDATVILSLMDSARKIVLPDGSANITLYGVVATTHVPCGTPEVIQVDLWSSQSSSAQRAHCVNCGIRYSDGYLTTTGFVNCSTLRYIGSITNNTNITIDGYYRVFADVNGDGYFTPTTDTLLQGNITFTVAPFGIQSISGSIPGANLNQNVFIVVTQITGGASGASRVILFRSTQCSPLPVVFNSFTATRINSVNVLLKWQTVTEINNSGFVVQRNSGNNTWESVGFISTQAANGNSNSLLVYIFNDINSNRGITQYRIKQVDIDGRSKLSDIRAVRGDAQKEKIIVYPNPSADGRLNILFEDKEGIRDVVMADMNGRIIRHWDGITSNSLQVENLHTGMYILRVTLRGGGSQTIEKIIVF